MLDANRSARDGAAPNSVGVTGRLRRRDFFQRLALLPGLAAVRPQEVVEPRPPYVDGLTFLPRQDADVVESGLTSFLADVSAARRIETDDGSLRFVRTFDACWKSIVAARRRLRESDLLFAATRGSQIAEGRRQGRVGVFLQFQGCEPLEGDLEKLDLFHELGLRILQITHHNDNPFGGGALQPVPRGLTDLGFQAVEKMNSLGVVPDVSHASDATSLDVIRSSKRPVILSHGAARELVPSARCAPDEVIRGIADSGGVMGVFMMSFWLTSDPVPSPEAYVRQLRHVIDVGGIEAVGIANDFSIRGNEALAKIGNDNARGVEGYFPWWDTIASDGVPGFEVRPRHVVIPEFNHVRRFFSIHRSLEQAGFKQPEIERILGGNWIRVLTESLGGGSAEPQGRERPPN